MKLKEFLRCMEREFVDLINIKIEFDLGIDTNMNISDKSRNRIKFSIIKQAPKKKKK